jgi:carbamoyl-phosphate synthase large subunit|tara:strand:+ start:1521 stop:2528 length:1008 start_codon:yes stop_codon:yes gene_type:complete
LKKKRTVLFTGAGGSVAPALIKRLQDNGYRVIAADIDRYAVGLYLADVGVISVRGDSPDFIKVMKDICEEEKVDVLITGVDEELIPSFELEKNNIVVLLPNQKFVSTCLDKYALMKALDSQGIPIPETRLAESGPGDISYPLVVKPRRGRGSRGLGILNRKAELHSFIEQSPYKTDELIIQECIHGLEYTVSVVLWRDGEIQAVVPKEVICKRGITKLAVTRHNQRINQLCYEIQEKLHADGPFNVQLIIDKNTGKPYPIEINPRFSTTISLTIASGIDELIGLTKQALDGRKSYDFGDWKEGVVLLRQNQDQFITENKFNQKKIINKGNYFGTS